MKTAPAVPLTRSLPPGRGHPRAPLPWPKGHTGLILAARAASSSPCPWRQLRISPGESAGARGRGLPPSPRKRSPGTGLQLRGRRGVLLSAPRAAAGLGQGSRAACVTRVGRGTTRRVARGWRGLFCQDPDMPSNPASSKCGPRRCPRPEVVTSRLSVGSQRWGCPARKVVAEPSLEHQVGARSQGH